MIHAGIRDSTAYETRQPGNEKKKTKAVPSFEFARVKEQH